MKSIEEAKRLIESGGATYRRARRQGEATRKPWSEYTDSTKKRKTQRLRKALDSATEGGAYIHSRNIEVIYGYQTDIDTAIRRYLFDGDREGKEFADRTQEEYKAFLASLQLPSPLPQSRSARAKLWGNVKAQVLEEDAERERQSLIREFGLDEGITLKRARNAANKQKTQLREQAERERLGLGEEADVSLAAELSHKAAKAVGSISVQGYLYLRCWVLPDGNRWYKIGITGDPKRRESEQNVLPVNMETLALASFHSYEQARAAEMAFHAVLDAHRIRGAQNKELFHLKPKQVTAVIAAINSISFG